MEKVTCPICRSENYEIKIPAKYDKETQKDLTQKYRSSGDETLIDQVVECECGMVYVNPRPEADKIVEGYSEGSDENFVSQAKGRELTFKKCLNIIEKHKPNKGKVLDVGTAGGSFLKVAKDNGWEVKGVEPNKWLCNWGQQNYGIKIEQGVLTKELFEGEKFDVITLWDVLEHVPDPNQTLEIVHSLLKDDGLLIVNYPDYNSSVGKVLGNRWMFWLSVHLFYYTKKTIVQQLRMQSFEVIKIRKHWQTLNLGYLVFRMKAYSKLLHKLGNVFVKVFKADKWMIPYYLGQEIVIAKKEVI